jgi:hypothetical protein
MGCGEYPRTQGKLFILGLDRRVIDGLRYRQPEGMAMNLKTVKGVGGQDGGDGRNDHGS